MFGKMIINPPAAGDSRFPIRARHIESHQPYDLWACVAVVHLSVIVLGWNEDFSSLWRIDMIDALFHQVRRIPQKHVELSLYLYMAYSTSNSLVKACICNPGIESKKNKHLLLFFIFMDGKPSEEVYASALIQILANISKDCAKFWEGKSRLANCRRRKR